jgi:D-arabinose 5-phosphate isomerase GutQ
MADYGWAEAIPVKTSAVLVLNGKKHQSDPPPSPPSDSPLKAGTPTRSSLVDGLNAADVDATPTKRRVADGLHVLNTEADALRSLAAFYEDDVGAQDRFARAVETIAWSRRTGSKLVITGVGKSGHIGRKLVSTFQSLGIPSVFLHPTEALHGDLGLVGHNDSLVIISFSGKTSELLQLLPHLHRSIRMIVLTSHVRPEACELLLRKPDGVLLSAPIPETETVSLGVAAPTTSTTVALALGDALAIATAKELHADVPTVFARNHPGGSIGESLK